jgi:NAD(P)-dependent dehydrogenase (short-subunit alcohol dehydrogenase family)
MTNSLHNKTVLITGGTGGIGKQTAIGLARLGAHVVVTGHDRTRGAAALAEIKRASGNEHVALLLADHSSQHEVRRLAEEFRARHQRLDVLINNVGGLYRERWETEDGIEATLAINHLTPFLLTHLLLDLLKISAPARVINVTGGRPTMRPDLSNLQAERFYRGLVTYSHAKAVMMVAAYEFAKRLQGSGVSLNVVYPGLASTAMTAGMRSDMLPMGMRLLWPVFGRIARAAKPERAARSSIYLASSPELADVSGAYYDTNGQPSSWPKAVHDQTLREQIWAISTDLVGLGGRASFAFQGAALLSTGI